MIFYVVVHKDTDSSYGVTIPDIPGCFTAGDTLEEAIKNIQEAVECHLHDATEIPKPNHDLEKLMADSNYEGGIWVAVNIDMSFISGKTVRVNVTIPEKILYQIDIEAKKNGLSRSAFLVESAKKVIQVKEQRFL